MNVKRPLIASLAVFAIAVPAVFACGDVAICTVSDPTGSALNVRSDPNAAIVATIENGVEVEYIQSQIVDGKEWAQVSLSGPSWGYVELATLVCDQSDDYSDICTIKSRDGSVDVVDEPGGMVYGDLDNGIKVRPYDQYEVDGVTWAAIERFSDDNVLGWVFSSYVDCGDHTHA